MGKQIIPNVDKDYHFRILKNLMNFSKANKFQKTIISVLIGLKAEKSEIKKLEIAF
jgi:hypothetical protein